MVRIGEYKVRKYSTRGLEISLPKTWFHDRGVRPGDVVDFYRDDEDRLVIVPRRNDEQHGSIRGIS